jgi:uncharacterized membrane protein YgdD (TMEM256/DUF423 family)
MTRVWLVAAACAGVLSVAAGAAAAHLAGGGEPRAAELLRTGALYGMVHAAALVAVAALIERRERPYLLLAIAGWSLAAGTCLFSFSLFGLALTRWLWLAAVTPFGGTLLLVGWAALGLGALRRG